MKTIVGMLTTVLIALSVCLPNLLGQDPAVAKALKPFESFDEMHANYVERFIASEGFGRARMPQPLMLDHSRPVALGSDIYSVESLELVGILKQEEPVVYRPMPHRVGGGRHFSVPRKLTEFESKSLERLRKGEELLIDQTDDGTFLLGAVRAQASCLECHSDKKQGDLLGAFTYKLKRTENRPPFGDQNGK
jgi:hypothetical protein